MNHPNQPGEYGRGPHPGYGTPPPAPRRKRKVWPWIVGGILVVIVLGFAGCVAVIGGAASAVNEANQPVTLRYELAGEGTAGNVSWTTASGSSQVADAALPWSTEVSYENGLGAIGSLTAQAGAEGGDLTCRIIDVGTGAVVAESTSSGEYAVVSCVGSPSTP